MNAAEFVRHAALGIASGRYASEQSALPQYTDLMTRILRATRILLTPERDQLTREERGDEVWDAASEQLDARYAREWRAGECGVYIVLWFGDVRNKQLRRHPDGLARPETPRELQELLSARIPEARRSQIDVVVMDVTRPPDAA